MVAWERITVASHTVIRSTLAGSGWSARFTFFKVSSTRRRNLLGSRGGVVPVSSR
jgi:hypothetical protein